MICFCQLWVSKRVFGSFVQLVLGLEEGFGNCVRPVLGFGLQVSEELLQRLDFGATFATLLFSRNVPGDSLAAFRLLMGTVNAKPTF